jgi:uncharacterized DUF497 family protein
MIDIDQIAGFDWDDGNSRKSADKHDVSRAEAESVFFNDPLIVVADAKHSGKEQRLNALGKTAQNRLLHVTFTLRQNGTAIRVISARDMQRSGRSMNKLKSIPAFKSEAEERKFWETHDSTDYIDWSKAERVRFPNLKPSTTAISIRLPLGLLEQIKIAANKRDVPYQSLIKMWLAEKVG